jgi:UDPglucose 6-dehydrogenase
VKKIAVIGAGYVGLVTGACFAQKDNFVVVVERDEKKVEALLNGKIPFYEPGLDQLVSLAIKNKKIIFVPNILQAFLNDVQIVFSCVGTPSLPDGSADLSAVFAVAQEVGNNMNNYCLFINKSTVPVGTAKKVEQIISSQLQKRKLNLNFDVASNPEFLKEGDALSDFLLPDRVVLGVESQKAEQILKDLYAPFIKEESQLLVMNRESAELTKYASNAMLATRISFMNQLAIFADKVGADISLVKIGMSKDKRIGGSFLNAGIGYGGSCFPKDVKALVHMGKEHNIPMSLVDEVEKINDQQRIRFAEQILNFYESKIVQKTIGIWGLAFKPETDDIRCAPSIDIIKKLLDAGAKVVAYDPVAFENFKIIFGDKIEYALSAHEILGKSDSLLLLTEWREFSKFKPTDFFELKDKVVFDGRNFFDPIEMKKSGIIYFSVGRNVVGEGLDNIAQGLRARATSMSPTGGF